MAGINSRWQTKDIEVSDDEDDTHPNVDTGSLFRWRHDGRLQRDEAMKEAKKELEEKKTQLQRTKLIFEETKTKADGEDIKRLEKIIANMELELQEEQNMMDKQERLKPWNIDTICREGVSKTVINKSETSMSDENLSEEERGVRLQQFIKKNKSLLKTFGLLHKYEDSRTFLLKYPHLACEDTNNYLVIWCINLAQEGKMDLVNHVSHQIIAMQFLFQLSKQLNADPRGCITPFFSKIAHLENSAYKEAFDSELSLFKDRIKCRAEEKIREAEKLKEEERAERIAESPGGLDPFEVLESLPEEMRICFDRRDIPLLQQTVAAMEPKVANYHLKRCIDSGLWMPERKQEKNSDSDAGPVSEGGEQADDESDEVPKQKFVAKAGYSQVLWFCGFLAIGILAFLYSLRN